MHESPKITIYITAHNCAPYLEAAIESVLRQSMDDWELIIVDDGSSDETPAVLQPYRDVEGITILTTEGVGLPAACNRALEVAKGEYFMRLDGDDVLDENIFLVLANFLDRNPDVALVFPDFYHINSDGDLMSLNRINRIYERNNFVDMPPNGACTMVRTEVLLKVGGYREDLGAQDGLDLWTKVRDKYRTANVNLPLFYYRRHDTNLTNNIDRILFARRGIKRDVAAEALKREGPVIGVILCRKNYDFCKNVWKQKVGNKTLLDYKLELFTASSIFDIIVVACDTEEVIPYMREYSDPRIKFFVRDSKNTLRSVNVAVTLRNIVKQFDPGMRGITLLSYVQSPFISIDAMEESLHTLVMSKADSAIGVEEDNLPVYRRTSHGLEAVNPPREFNTDFDSLYFERNTIMATRTRNLVDGSLIGIKVAHFILKDAESYFIGSHQALRIARIMIGERA